MKTILFSASAVILAGCQFLGYPDKAVGIDGYFARVSEAGALLGTGKITTVPKDAKYMHAEYNEDTAFFSPSTKTRSWELTITGGTNWVPAEAYTSLDAMIKYRKNREAEDEVTSTNVTAEASSQNTPE